MKIVGASSGGQGTIPAQNGLQAQGESLTNRGMGWFYALMLIVSVAIWLIAIRAPLRVDETGSYWQIAGGLSGIWQRQFLSLGSPAYSYILWFSTKLLGTSEIALRMPSVLAMLGAAYLLYLAARELVDPQFAAIATIVFSLNYSVVFGAIDVRPYAFAVLLTSASILTLLRLRTNDSNWLAALFGLLAAGVVYFHFLFAAILPALLVCFVAFRARNRKILLRQCCIALAVFTAACIPLVPELQYLARTPNSHVVGPTPDLSALRRALVPEWLFLSAALTFALTALFFAARNRPVGIMHFERWQVLFVACLASIPVAILYTASVATSLPIFSTHYHRLSAIPGISLCWAMALYRFRPNVVRATFCIIFVGLTASPYVRSPKSKEHDYSWKYALRVVEDRSAKDDAPVVICSNFIEANYVAMPTESPKADRLFAPLSYYKITSPIVPLPEGLNDETRKVFLRFLREAEQKHERFFAVGHEFSFQALDWIADTAATEYSVHSVGIFDRVRILEFVPRGGPIGPEPEKSER